MPIGISQKNVDPASFLALTRDQVQFPIAAAVNHVTSASDGGAAAAFSITSATPGTVVHRSGVGKRSFPYARRLSVTKTDASGTNLTVSVQIIGRRFGQVVRETVVCNAEGTETKSSVFMYDEVTSITIVNIANAAASDTLGVGVDGSWLGLLKPIRRVNDVCSVFRIVNGTPDVAGPKIKTELSSTLVDVRGGGINVNTLYSAVIAVTHIYVIEYLAHGEPEFVQRAGVKFA